MFSSFLFFFSLVNEDGHFFLSFRFSFFLSHYFDAFYWIIFLYRINKRHLEETCNFSDVSEMSLGKNPLLFLQLYTALYKYVRQLIIVQAENNVI
jgi:hypothetical protein